MVFATGATPTLAGTGLADRVIPGGPLPPWAAIMLAMLCAAALAVAIERWIVRRRENAAAVSVGLTIGVLLLANSTTTYVWRPINRGFSSPFPTSPGDYWPVLGARLRYEHVGTLLTLVLVVVAISVILKRTKFGLAFRAVSSDPGTAELMGVRSSRVLSAGWAAAAAVGTLAGALVANRLVLEPDMMVRLLVFGFAAATIGGLDSLNGAVIGGLLVGVLETLLVGYVTVVGTALSLPLMLVLMVTTLLVRPTGLLGTARVTRV